MPKDYYILVGCHVAGLPMLIVNHNWFEALWLVSSFAWVNAYYSLLERVDKKP